MVDCKYGETWLEFNYHAYDRATRAAPMRSTRRMCQTVRSASKYAIGFPIYDALIVVALTGFPIESFQS